MSLFDNLASAALGQLGKSGALGDVMAMAAQNPQLMQMAGNLLSDQGGAGGLQGILGKLTHGGLGDAAQSWVGTGQNQAVTPDQLANALGPDMIAGLAAKAGVSTGDASGMLAQVLPLLIDKMTPNGAVDSAAPTGQDQIMNLLGGLLKG